MQSTQTMLLERAMQPEVLGILVPIVAMLAVTAVWITKLWIRHRERMAMIEMGMNPDQRPEKAAGNDAEFRFDATVARDDYRR